MYDKAKNTTISFRTYEDVDEKLKKLAARIDAVKWEFSWRSKIRECTSKSGLISQILSEKLTFAEIREELEKAEKKKAQEV